MSFDEKRRFQSENSENAVLDYFRINPDKNEKSSASLLSLASLCMIVWLISGILQEGGMNFFGFFF